MPSEVNSPTVRAGIYARYSSARLSATTASIAPADNQRDASIDDQVRICGAEIERNGWDLVQVYTDPGISGASTFRPGYQKLLQDATAPHDRRPDRGAIVAPSDRIVERAAGRSVTRI